MKFALVENKKTKAEKGLKGVCPVCQQPVIPKCGPVKIDHWAHKSCSHCDKWWENETEWHRKWKNHFPEEWQEIVAFDEKTGEKHIADVKTKNGMVIEFQHSYIKDEERISREAFYQNMVWIADGARRKRDFVDFCRLLEYGNIWHIHQTGLYVIKNGINSFPKEWRNSSVPVLFDFSNIEESDAFECDQRKKFLWCLLPIRNNGLNLCAIFALSIKQFVEDVINERFGFNYAEIVNLINQSNRKHALFKVKIGSR